MVFLSDNDDMFVNVPDNHDITFKVAVISWEICCCNIIIDDFDFHCKWSRHVSISPMCLLKVATSHYEIYFVIYISNFLGLKTNYFPCK